MGCSCRTFRNEPFAEGPQDLRADKKKTPLGAGQVLSVLPDMPFDPEPYVP